MKKSSLLVMTLFLASCGSNFTQSAITPDIGSVRVHLPVDVVEVGEPVQVSLSITLTTGERIDGVTQVFTNPETNESLVIEWSTSNVRLARIDNYGELTAQQGGYVTIYAQLGDIERMREVRIAEPNWYQPGSPVYDEVVGGDDDIDLTDDPDSEPDPDPDPDPIPCQGHAVSVYSFTPGANAGFGSSEYPAIVLGAPEGNGGGAGGYDVLSLGTYGEIILDLGSCELVDGPGADLIVFENAFLIAGDPANPFHEFAAVGVSGDGVNFVEFVCDQSAYPFEGCAGVQPVYSNSTNGISPFDVAVAGGDAFDLATIGVGRARYVRIRDLGDRPPGGTVAGFDLDAISVVNGEQPYAN